jgi:hypothetical protein
VSPLVLRTENGQKISEKMTKFELDIRNSFRKNYKQRKSIEIRDRIFFMEE